MQLTKNIQTKTREIIIGQKLIEVGDSSWQIMNLTGISSQELKITPSTPEPTFSDPEPQGEFRNIKFPWILFAPGIPYFLWDEGHVWWAILAAIIAVFVIYNPKVSEKEAWKNKFDDYKKQLATWQEMKNNPPLLYSLEIETNSGSRPIFYSFDKEGISKAVKAIKTAMEKPVEERIIYNINAVDLSGDITVNNVVNNVGNEIYQQNIRG